MSILSYKIVSSPVPRTKSDAEMERILEIFHPFLKKAKPGEDLTKLICLILADDANLTPRERDQLLIAQKPLDWLTTKLSNIITSNTWALFCMKRSDIKNLIDCLNKEENTLATFQTLYKSMNLRSSRVATTSECHEPPQKKRKTEHKHAKSAPVPAPSASIPPAQINPPTEDCDLSLLLEETGNDPANLSYLWSPSPPRNVSGRLSPDSSPSSPKSLSEFLKTLPVLDLSLTDGPSHYTSRLSPDSLFSESESPEESHPKPPDAPQRPVFLAAPIPLPPAAEYTPLKRTPSPRYIRCTSDDLY